MAELIKGRGKATDSEKLNRPLLGFDRRAPQNRISWHATDPGSKKAGLQMKPVIVRMCIGFILAIACAGAAKADDADEARQILASSGLRAGVCLHLGCGRTESAGLTAALAENPNFTVHALALDDAALVRARERIEAGGLAGRAVAEKVDCDPLPYVSNLANLVVVEDMTALATRGVAREEILRVLAPGGMLFIKEGSTWTKTVKPRPSEMDDWGHPMHGPDGNWVSRDGTIRFPLGLRWIGGLSRCISGIWGQYGAWVVAGGRCFTFSRNERENILPGGYQGFDYFLAAYDAFNGMPLWKINCGPFKAMNRTILWPQDLTLSNWHNAGQPVADGRRVYAVQDMNKLIIVDSANGELLHTCATKHPPVRLVLLDGLLLAGCWEEGREASKYRPDGIDKRAAYFPKTGAGSLEAFDAETGEVKWSAPFASYQLMASHGTVYGLTHRGNPPTEREVVCLDLKTGRERWRVPHTRFGPKADLQLNCAGAGFVVIAKRENFAVFVLSAEDGKMLWKACPVRSIWTPVIDGLLWCDLPDGGKKFDPLTGEAKGDLPAAVRMTHPSGVVATTVLDPLPESDGQMCARSVMVGPYICRTRMCLYQEIVSEDERLGLKAHTYKAARGACGQGAVPANGMFYTGLAGGCTCFPSQPSGFVAFGSSGPLPTATDFRKERPIEKGPAFGVATADTGGDGEWPTYRHDAGRSAATTASVPEKLTELWRSRATAPLPDEGLVAEAFKSRLTSPLSAPVVAGERVLVAGTEAGQIVAFAAATGEMLWKTTLGGRIDTPPTIHRGLCLVGCHDGWIYALAAEDGRLAWRVRAAPLERRMAVHGQLESLWPATGSVLVDRDVAYVSAGRSTESDGGIALIALDPADGKQIWRGTLQGEARQGREYRGRPNDLLVLQDHCPALGNLKLDPKTGTFTLIQLPGWALGKGGAPMNKLDESWQVQSRPGMRPRWVYGRAGADVMAWNDRMIVTPEQALRHETAFPEDPKLSGQPLGKTEPLWRVDSRGRKVLAVALTANAALHAGRIVNYRSTAPTKGFFRSLALADGQVLCEIPLKSPPTCDGIAVAGERVYVSLQNGMLVCLGK